MKCNQANMEGTTCDSTACSTWDVLQSLGFVPDISTASPRSDQLFIYCGNFKLSALQCMNRCFRRIILLSGVVRTRETITEVHCELPVEVESWEHGVAFVTWCFDNYHLVSAISLPWLEIGRQHRHLLPWEQERAAYAARPHCAMQRVWARVALNNLATCLAAVDENLLVTFYFDGEILTIRCLDQLIALSATGTAWPCRYSIKAGALYRLPKRLMRESVDFSIWQSALCIGNMRYPEVVADNGREL